MNKLSYYILVFFFSCILNLQAQKDTEILMKVNKTEVDIASLKHLYKKGNFNSLDSKDEFLKIASDYYLKLEEAKRLKLDKDRMYIQEVGGYKANVLRQYLEADQLTQEILDRLYQRSKYEIHASHILVELPPYAFGKDTLRAYNKIRDIVLKLRLGQDFGDLALKESDDRSVQENKGDLGYFGSLQMVMEFEEAAFNTPIGEISEIIRTGFGYHVLKVHAKRPARPDLQVSYIYTEPSEIGEAQINKAYQDLEAGNDFASVARIYSQDKQTKDKGGKMPNLFNPRDIKNQMVLENTYALKEGEYTKPFRNEMGWYITYVEEIISEKSKEDKIEEIKKFFKDPSSKLYLDNMVYEAMADKYNLKFKSESLVEDLKRTLSKEYSIYYLSAIIDPLELVESENKILFELNNQAYTYNDYLEFAADNRVGVTMGHTLEEVTQMVFKDFVRHSINEIYLSELFKQEPELRFQLMDLEEGHLIFNVMAKEVWRKMQINDDILKAFFLENQDKYQSENFYLTETLTFNSKKKAKSALKKFKKNTNFETNEWAMKNKLPYVHSLDFINSDKNKKTEGMKIKTLDKTNHILEIVKRPKLGQQIQFEDVKLYVENDYRKQVEEDWLEELRAKHDLKIDESQWVKLRKTL